jgi:hypothetical protein
MSWIKYRINLPTDPRVVCIAAMVKRPALHVCGGLMAIWAIADQHTTDGVLPGYTVEAIDMATGIEGFGGAMRVVGWLEVGEGFVAIPRFNEHNGTSAKARLQGALRVERHRCNGPSVTKALPEKRREEKRTSSTPKQEPAASGVDGDADESLDSGLEGRKAFWRKKPEWWPSKPWISAGGVNELAAITRDFTNDEVRALLTDARRQCATLANPAGYVMKSVRDAAKAAEVAVKIGSKPGDDSPSGVPAASGHPPRPLSLNPSGAIHTAKAAGGAA